MPEETTEPTPRLQCSPSEFPGLDLRGQMEHESWAGGDAFEYRAGADQIVFSNEDEGHGDAQEAMIEWEAEQEALRKRAEAMRELRERNLINDRQQLKEKNATLSDAAFELIAEKMAMVNDRYKKLCEDRNDLTNSE